MQLCRKPKWYETNIHRISLSFLDDRITSKFNRLILRCKKPKVFIGSKLPEPWVTDGLTRLSSRLYRRYIVALEWDIPNELPYNDYFEYSGLNFKLHIAPRNMSNENTSE